jgi:fimbrial chaperone protein
MLERSVRSLLGNALLLGCMLACGPATAASVSVNPVRATLSAKRPVAALTVTNTSGTSAVFQLQAMSWSQQDGKNVYTPSKEILATPPIFTIPAGASQLVRVGLRRAADPRQELSYRLYLQEIRPPPKPGFNGLQMSLRLGLPVFVLPLADTSPILRWQATAIEPGTIRITATNAGNVHMHIVDFQLLQSVGAAPLATRQTASYVMPGQSMAWDVEASARPGSTLQLIAQTDAGNVEAKLAVDDK